MPIHFATFAAGVKKHHDDAVNALASAVDLFDSSTIYTEEFLKLHNDFWNKHSNFISFNARGYGYWIWKPFLIHTLMKTMEDGDFLYYMDADHSFNKTANITKFATHARNNKILCTSTGNNDLLWTKMDTINRVYPSLKSNDIQLQAGILFIHVEPLTRKFVKEWYDICCENNYHFIDDSDSVTKNAVGFKEHRHDQSIFSLLMKKYEITFNVTLIPLIARETKKIARRKTGRRS